MQKCIASVTRYASCPAHGTGLYTPQLLFLLAVLVGVLMSMMCKQLSLLLLMTCWDPHVRSQRDPEVRDCCLPLALLGPTGGIIRGLPLSWPLMSIMLYTALAAACACVKQVDQLETQHISSRCTCKSLHKASRACFETGH